MYQLTSTKHNQNISKGREKESQSEMSRYPIASEAPDNLCEDLLAPGEGCYEMPTDRDFKPNGRSMGVCYSDQSILTADSSLTTAGEVVIGIAEMREHLLSFCDTTSRYMLRLVSKTLNVAISKVYPPRSFLSEYSDGDRLLSPYFVQEMSSMRVPVDPNLCIIENIRLVMCHMKYIDWTPQIKGWYFVVAFSMCLGDFSPSYFTEMLDEVPKWDLKWDKQTVRKFIAQGTINTDFQKETSLDYKKKFLDRFPAFR